MQPITFSYKNHRGEMQQRTIVPDALEFIFAPDPKYNHQPGWFISGYDKEKYARRSFALSNIILDGNGFHENETGMKFFKLFLRDTRK